jgi:hypothetical protein
VTIKDLDAIAPADLWREVPLEEEFWVQARERPRRGGATATASVSGI